MTNFPAGQWWNHDQRSGLFHVRVCTVTKTSGRSHSQLGVSQRGKSWGTIILDEADTWRLSRLSVENDSCFFATACIVLQRMTTVARAIARWCEDEPSGTVLLGYRSMATNLFPASNETLQSMKETHFPELFNRRANSSQRRALTNIETANGFCFFVDTSRRAVGGPQARNRNEAGDMTLRTHWAH